MMDFWHAKRSGVLIGEKRSGSWSDGFARWTKSAQAILDAVDKAKAAHV
jgi:hypothetical protein